MFQNFSWNIFHFLLFQKRLAETWNCFGSCGIKLKKHELKCNCSSLWGGGRRVFTRNTLAVWLGQLSVWGNIANLFPLHMDKWWYISVLHIVRVPWVQKCLVLRKLPSLEWKAAAIFSSVLQHCTGEHRMMLLPQLTSWMTLLIYWGLMTN